MRTGLWVQGFLPAKGARCLELIRMCQPARRILHRCSRLTCRRRDKVAEWWSCGFTGVPRIASLGSSWTISFGRVGCTSCLVRRFVKSSASNALYQAVFPMKGL